MCESRVYPSTLTYQGALHNIEILRPMAELRSARVVGDTSLWQLRGRCDDLSRGGSPRKQQMFMRSLEINARHRRHRTSGFSLVEMTIVVAITITLTVVAVITLVPLLQAQHVTNAYNMTLAALRQARDNAVSQRTSYSVTFANKVSPSPYATIAVAWAPASGETSLTNGTSNGLTPATVTYQLSTDVSFLTPPAGTTSPDGYGTGTHAIDFGYTASSSTGEQPPFTSVRTVRSRTRICAPDSETGTGASSTWCSGNAYSDRAVDVWGATGRIRGWRLYNITGTTYQWLRQ